MNFLDTRVRIQHPCPFCDFSATFPDVQMTLWCNGSNEVLQIMAPNPSRLADVLHAAQERLGAYDMFRDGQSALTMTRDCRCRKYRSVSSIAEENMLWLVPPVAYHGGWEFHRIISPGTKPLATFVAEMKKSGRIEVISHFPRDRLDIIHDIGAVPVHFFEGLTDRQIHALVSAYESGLFEVPAKTSIGRIAKREGLSRSTLGEHLRKAHLRILRNSYPYLKLKDVGTKEIKLVT